MNAVQFHNVRIFDGTGDPRHFGSVVTRGQVIELVSRSAKPLRHSDCLVVDGLGGTLMPGLVEAHAQKGGQFHKLPDLGGQPKRLLS